MLGLAQAHTAVTELAQPGALTRQGTGGMEGQVTPERWHRSLKVGLGHRCWKLTARDQPQNPGLTEPASGGRLSIWQEFN